HLQDLITSRGIAILLVTHDLAVAAERADRMVVMHHGRIVETGTTAAILDDPKDAYTQRLLAAAPVFNHALQPPEPLPETTEWLLEDTDHHNRCVLRGGRGTKRQRVAAVDGDTFQLLAGETMALVAESGSGKSTTTRRVLGLANPDAGTIT